MICKFCKSNNLLRVFNLFDSSIQLKNIFLCERCFSIQAIYDITENNLVHEQTVYHNKLFSDMDELVSEQLLQDNINMMSKYQKYLGAKNDFCCEIGTGRGGLLSALKNMNYKIIGTEASKYLYDLSRKYFNFNESELYNLEVKEFLSFLEKENIKIETFILWHVLEHLEYADEIIQRLVKLLNDEGSIILQLPLLYEKYLYKEHLFFFTNKTLEYICSKYSLNLIHHEYDFYNLYITLIFTKNTKIKSADYQKFDSLADELMYVYNMGINELKLANKLNTSIIEEKEEAIKIQSKMIDERDRTIDGFGKLVEEKEEAIKIQSKMIDERDIRLNYYANRYKILEIIFKGKK